MTHSILDPQEKSGCVFNIILDESRMSEQHYGQAQYSYVTERPTSRSQTDHGLQVDVPVVASCGWSPFGASLSIPSSHASVKVQGNGFKEHRNRTMLHKTQHSSLPSRRQHNSVIHVRASAQRWWWWRWQE
jgi:hypothetical protein